MAEKPTKNAENQAVQDILSAIGRNPALLGKGAVNCGYCGWAFQAWLSALGRRKPRRTSGESDRADHPRHTPATDR